MRQQLFILDRHMLNLVGLEETGRTFSDMEKLGIAKPPYDEFTLQVPMGAVINSSDRGTLDKMALDGDERAIRLKDAPLQVVYRGGFSGSFAVQVSDSTHKRWRTLDSFLYEHMHLYPLMAQHQEQMANMAKHLMALLIVLLATRNVERHVTHNRLARLGVGKQQYEYVTTLKIGQVYEEDGITPVPTGDTRRPHLRRGHIRRQRYGPGYQYVREIWVDPVFVNGYNPNENGGRIAYNVSFRR